MLYSSRFVLYFAYGLGIQSEIRVKSVDALERSVSDRKPIIRGAAASSRSRGCPISGSRQEMVPPRDNPRAAEVASAPPAGRSPSNFTG